MAEPLVPFHLALPVHDLGAARGFYIDLLGCPTGRTASRWTDLDFFGHQLTLHLVDADETTGNRNPGNTNPVDGDDVPARHFGVVLTRDDWDALRGKLENAGARFLIEPKIRFEGEPGEQATMFVTDPSGNALEFKSFADPGMLFASE